MNLDLVNNIVNDMKNNKLVQSFIKELQNYLESSISKNSYINIEKEDIPLVNPTHNGNKITAKYRDKMYTKRAHILNNYEKQTLDKGKMYYIYDKNSKMPDGYNLCICEEGNSHTVIEKSKDDLPNGVKIGSVLRMAEDDFILDEEATKEISQEIYKMKDELLKEQTKFLESKRIEGHIYEMSENSGDRAWLYDITNESSNGIEGVEEIDFPKELLKDGIEGDLFIYENGKYQKYLNKKKRSRI